MTNQEAERMGVHSFLAGGMWLRSHCSLFVCLFSVDTVFKEKFSIFPENKFNKYLLSLGALTVKRKHAISVLGSKGFPGEAAFPR